MKSGTFGRWSIIIARLSFLFAAGVLFYYGAVFLLIVPGAPGESYFVRERWVYGVLPVLAGVLFVGVSTVLARGANSKRDFLHEMRRSFIYSGLWAASAFAVLCAIDLLRKHPEPIPSFTKARTGAVPLQIDFINSSRSHLAVEVRLGTNGCTADPVVHTQEINGDAGFVLAIAALPDEHLCWRITSSRDRRESSWGDWHVLARELRGKADKETYEISLE